MSVEGPKFILETARLSLHQLRPSDAPFIFELLNSRGFLANIGDRGIRNQADAEAYISRIRASYATNAFGLWRCQVRSDGASIGICGLVKREGLEHPDIGYAFLEKYWGFGYATEASLACMTYARTELNLSKILAVTTHANVASLSVLKKLEMRDVGTVLLPGAEREIALFST